MVRATTRRPGPVSGSMWPRVTVQRMRLWANTAQTSQAAFARKLSGRDVFEAGAFFEVADVQLDHGVVAVEQIGVDGVVGDERMVTPVRPEGRLGGVGESGSAHDEPVVPVGRFGDLGGAAGRVVDVDPGVFVDRRDGCFHAVVLGNGDRVADIQPAKRGDRLRRPEPRIGSHDDRAGCSGSSDAGDEFFDEPFGAALGVGGAFAHPGVEDLADVSPGRQQRVVAEVVGVAVAGALLVMPVDFGDRRVDVDRGC